MCIQTLREQGYSYTVRLLLNIPADKNSKLDTVKAIRKRVDTRKSAIARKRGSGRPQIIRTDVDSMSLF